MKRNCLICGKEFSTYPSRIKKGRGKFCSKPCFYKGRYKPNRKGKNNPFYGKKHSKKWKEYLSEQSKGKQNPHFGKPHTKETKKKMREFQIKYMTSEKVKYKDTSIERAMEQELIKNKIPYAKQVPIEEIALVDFSLQNKIIVQCDGDYWHNRPGIKNRDAKQDILLGQCGISYL